MARPQAVLLVVLIAAAVGVAVWISTGDSADGPGPAQPADRPAVPPVEPGPPEALPDGAPPAVDPADSNLTGTVVDPDGSPVAGAEVWRQPGLAASVRTGADGAFAFPTQAPGELRLLAKAPGFAPGMTDVLTLAEDDRLEGVEVRLAAPGAISGRVATDAGDPVAGADLVMISGHGANIALLMLRGHPAAARTGEDGAFRIDELSPGRYRFRAVAEGYAPVLSEPVHVTAGGSASLEVVLEAGPVITGRVVDREGNPVGFASVGPVPPAVPTTMSAGTAGLGVVTKENGTFVLAGIKEPTTLQAVADGFATAKLEKVSPGQSGVEFVLGGLGSISGRVVGDATGEPPAAFEVRAVATKSPFPGMPAFQPSGAAEAQDAGRFRITGLEPGSYHVEVYPEGSFAPGKAAQIEVKEGADTSGVEVRLVEGFTLRGRVVRASDGRPVGGAEISADLSGNPMIAMIGLGKKRTARSGESGDFEIGGLPKGSTTLRIGHPDYAEAQMGNVAVPADAALDIQLVGGGTLTVVIQKADGAPDPSAMVVVQRNMPYKQLMGNADAEGKVRLTHVPPGTWMVMKMDLEAIREQGLAGLDLDMKTVTIVDGEAAEVLIRPEGGATVRGRVMRGEEPASGAMVYLTKEGEEAAALDDMKFGTSQPDGTYEIKGVAPGKYTLGVTQPGKFIPGHTERIEIGDTDIEHDVKLPFAEASGRVVDEAGRGLPDVQVAAVASEQAAFRTGEIGEAMGALAGLENSDAKGNFRFTGLAPGRYVVRAWKDGLSAAYSAPFEVPEYGAGPTNIEVTVAAGTEVRVIVRTPDGEPLGGAWVFATDEQDRIVPLTAMYGGTTGTDGSTAIRLAPGRYRIEVQASGHPSVFRELTVGRGAAPEVRLDLPRAGAIELTVVDAEGRAVADVRAELVDNSGRSVLRRMSGDAMADGWQRTRTDADGRLSFRLVSPGSYRVRAVTEDGRIVEKKVDVGAGETRAVKLTLEQP